MSRDFLLLYVASIQQLLDFVASANEFSKVGLLDKDTMIIVGVNLLASWIFVGLDGLQREYKGVTESMKMKYNQVCG